MAQDKSKVGGVHKQLNDMLYYDKVAAFFFVLGLFGNKLKYLLYQGAKETIPQP
jgi:hypothetical protein